jgi:DSF synthase
MEMMREIGDVQHLISRVLTDKPSQDDLPFDWYIMGSASPGIFSLGGDLSLFAERIRARDLQALRHYGRVAVETIHRTHSAFGAPVVTMAVVQGDALGGGFECALAHDLIVAERGAKLGVPEVLFNLFPGMGAYSFLSRRLGAARAERMLLSGTIYTAEELYAMGLVDVVAEDGEGERAARDYIARHARKHNAHRAIFQARRLVNPVTLEELRAVADVWAEAAIKLTEADLKKMGRLVAAQDRRIAGSGAATLAA